MTTTKTKTARRYFVAINTYRNSTGAGFSNTWQVYECATAVQQRRILRDGLPVRDEWLVGDDDIRRPLVTTIGVRRATGAEIRAAKRDGYIEPAEYGLEWAQ
jgi:hypothetical protein